MKYSIALYLYYKFEKGLQNKDEILKFEEKWDELQNLLEQKIPPKIFETKQRNKAKVDWIRKLTTIASFISRRETGH